MGAEIAESADAGNFWVGHPAVVFVEPAFKGAAMAVRAADASDFAEVAFGDFAFEEDVFGIGAHEIASSKKKAGFLDSVRHGNAFFAGDAKRFLGEHVFAGFGSREDKVMVAIGLGINDDGFDFWVGPDVLEIGDGAGVQVLGVFFGAGGIVVPDGFHGYVFAGFEQIDKARSVDVGSADECHSDFGLGLGKRRQNTGGECGGGSGAEKGAARRIHLEWLNKLNGLNKLNKEAPALNPAGASTTQKTD